MKVAIYARNSSDNHATLLRSGFQALMRDALNVDSMWSLSLFPLMPSAGVLFEF